MTDPVTPKTAGAVGGVTLLAIFVAFATNGKAASDGLLGLWAVLLAFTKDAPLGVASFFLALALAVFSQPYLQKWLPDLKCHLSREFIIESAALAIGFGVMLAQLRTLQGALAGILAGLLAPYLHKGIAAIWGLAGRGLRGVPPA